MLRSNALTVFMDSIEKKGLAADARKLAQQARRKSTSKPHTCHISDNSG